MSQRMPGDSSKLTLSGLCWLTLNVSVGNSPLLIFVTFYLPSVTKLGRGGGGVYCSPCVCMSLCLCVLTLSEDIHWIHTTQQCCQPSRGWQHPLDQFHVCCFFHVCLFLFFSCLFVVSFMLFVSFMFVVVPFMFIVFFHVVVSLMFVVSSMLSFFMFVIVVSFMLLFVSCLLLFHFMLFLSCLLLFLSCCFFHVCCCFFHVRFFLSCCCFFHVYCFFHVCYCFFYVCVLLFLSGSRSMPACAPNIAPSETRIRVCCAANIVDSFSAKSSLHADAKKKTKVSCDFCFLLLLGFLVTSWEG